MYEAYSPRDNAILGLLPDSAWQSIAPHLRLTAYAPAAGFRHANRSNGYICFPVSGIVARVNAVSTGHSVAFGLCGKEGAIGLEWVFPTVGGASCLGIPLVLTPVAAYLCPVHVFERGIADPGLLEVLFRYLRYMLAEAIVSCACNRLHTVEQQFCKLLLLCSDRARSREISITHQTISSVLGTRREGISEAVGRLRTTGIVSVARGTIRIVDRDAILRRACDCYDRLRADYERLLHGGVYAETFA